MIASSELVELAEKKLHNQIISKEILMHIVTPWIKIKKSPDTIVLGCTHFPLLLKELKEVLFKKTLFVDSRIAISKRAFG
ncbi:MAG: hypothetical protein ArsCj_2560 [Arsenophonus endosymbiont of Ceratovacuna japonica]